MSLNRFGDRKRRQLERLTGLEIFAASVQSDGRYAYASVGATYDDHIHVQIDRRTGEVELDRFHTHFTSCRELPGCTLEPWPGINA